MSKIFNFKFAFSLTFILFILSNSLLAQDKKAKARIDVKTDVELTLLKNCNYPGWRKNKDDYKKQVTSHSEKLFNNEWTDFEISFTPESDGMMTIILTGKNYGFDKETKKRKQVWVCFDNIKITGAEIQNADFEQIDAKGKLKFWSNCIPTSDCNFANSGENYIKVWHDRGCLYKKIKIKKGQKVTISAKVREV